MSRGDFGFGSVVLAFLGGAAAGAVAALLLAPKSGRETREQLAQYVATGRERVGERLGQLPEALREAGHAARETYQQTVGQLAGKQSARGAQQG